MNADDLPVRRNDRVFVVAVVFDLIATLGLCLTAVGAFVRGEALGLVFLGGAAGLAAAPGAVLSAIALRRAARHRGWPRGRFAVTAAALAVAAALIGPVVLVLAWSATPNPAATAAVPLENEIQTSGGRPLCTNGDPGRGPDNVVPWHEAYFTLPRSHATPQRLQELAASAGFEDLRRVAGRASSSSDAQRFMLRSEPSKRNDADLTIEVSAGGTQLNCDQNYGQTYRPAGSQVVIDLTSTINSTP